ncbi:Na+/H+ antiporter subunit A [Corynebacterium appendicis]|uniref:Na+/H+ antiporter subunit A n=1 Tax=Corynebacterium appendicis TaxID=163202 RepID=UPI002549E893|nr:Na+/H+ antiporter subunit A [Corynebacterium appendicis]MDK8626004.1 Na+/H+ antiporter subunit A [Corynebacterium appendicis]
MITLLLALIAATAAAPPLLRTFGRPAFGLLALVPGLGFGWLVYQFANGTFKDGGEILAAYPWMPGMHLNLEFRLDAYAGLFGLIILGVGALVLLYCWGYFNSNPRRLSIFGAELTMFAMAMYGLVIADNFLMMYIFWEITSVLSFLLVSYYGERASSRRAATQALLVTTFGGLAMLVGLILFGTQTGAWKISQIAGMTDLDQITGITAAVTLILLGALTKSAQAPFHFWLPGAMAAPTPVSAYLHSAAMVKAGIYVVGRLAPDFASISVWHIVVLPAGVFTMLLGGWMALKQRDLKLILAYGTVSQLGFMTAVVGVGSREATMAGLALVFAHSLFKAALFMIVGAIDHTSGTRDIRELSGLGRKEPLVAVLAAIAAASMAGIPPLWGFVAKEAVLEATLHEELLYGMPRNVLLVGFVLGSVLTMTYSLYFLWGAFARKPGKEMRAELIDGTSPAVRDMHPIEFLQLAPPAVLVLLTVIFGLVPAPLSNLFNQYLNVRFPEAEHQDLALWHGVTIPLGLSAVIIAAGAVMFWQREVVKKAQFERPALGDADALWDNMLIVLRQASLRLTASTQRGSLTINLAVIFSVLMVVPLGALLFGDSADTHMILWDNPWQGMTVVVIASAAVAATVIRNRLSLIILVGLTGYGSALLFALHGAPDLALTQVLVETLVMVVFMLVLRKLPTEIDVKKDADVRMRAWLSVGTGLSVVVVAMAAMSARMREPISKLMPDLAYEIGHGRNTVNVLLVDLRATDTLGEISVLVIAATGVASLIYRTESFTRDSRRPTLSTRRPRWLASGVEGEKAQNRSIMVDVVTRLLFPAMVLLSAYFFFSGHNSPGGGFAGGLVMGLALTLRYLAGGRDELEEALPVDPSKLLGTGLLLSGAAAVIPMFLGHPPLTSGYIEPEVPLIGAVTVPSALLFDAGVYTIVIGLVMHILTSLGGQIDREEDQRKERARDRARALHRKNEERKRAREENARQRAAERSEKRAQQRADERSSEQAAERIAQRVSQRSSQRRSQSSGSTRLKEHEGGTDVVDKRAENGREA